MTQIMTRSSINNRQQRQIGSNWTKRCLLTHIKCPTKTRWIQARALSTTV